MRETETGKISTVPKGNQCWSHSWCNANASQNNIISLNPLKSLRRVGVELCEHTIIWYIRVKCILCEGQFTPSDKIDKSTCTVPQTSNNVNVVKGKGYDKTF